MRAKLDGLATFLSKKLHGNYQDEPGNRYHAHIKGTRGAIPWEWFLLTVATRYAAAGAPTHF